MEAKKHGKLCKKPHTHCQMKKVMMSLAPLPLLSSSNL